VSKAAEPGPFFGWRPGGDGTHRVFFLDRNGAELSRMIDSEGVYVYIISTTTTDIA
jgi:hypothetical protein